MTGPCLVDDDMLDVPLVLNFDPARVIGSVRMRRAALAGLDKTNLVLSFGYRVNKAHLVDGVTVADDVEILCVSAITPEARPR
jgi:hypothetical protein